jgi:hypothetical protein
LSQRHISPRGPGIVPVRAPGPRPTGDGKAAERMAGGGVPGGDLTRHGLPGRCPGRRDQYVNERPVGGTATAM